VLPHVTDRRPAMWPWLLMPLAALTLFLALHSIRESAPQEASESSTRIGVD
jgi:hypothetical protein